MGWNPKFDLDLKFGQQGEQWLRMLGAPGSGVRIEVKTERDQWFATGNVVFEYACRNKPSGVSTTEAEFWVQLLSKDGCVVGIMGWPTMQLKAFLRDVIRRPGDYGARLVNGGDDKASQMVVIPLAQMHKVNTTEIL